MENYSGLGVKRFAVLFTKSLDVQRLSLREVSEITKKLSGFSVDKNTINSLKKGHTNEPTLNVLLRITPLVFRFDYFLIKNDEDAGIPQLKRSHVYSESEKDALLVAINLNQMPDSHLRFSSLREILDVLEDKSSVKKLKTSKLVR